MIRLNRWLGQHHECHAISMPLPMGHGIYATPITVNFKALNCGINKIGKFIAFNLCFKNRVTAVFKTMGSCGDVFSLTICRTSEQSSPGMCDLIWACLVVKLKAVHLFQKLQKVVNWKTSLVGICKFWKSLLLTDHFDELPK